MHDYFRELETAQGFIARSDVMGAGLDDRFIQHQLRHRTWVRIRNGAYAFSDDWRELDAVARHARVARAVIHAHRGAVVLSHVSALILHDTSDLWGVDLTRVHVTRRDGRSGSLERDVVHHQGRLRDDEVELVSGVPVVGLARCIAETIAVSGVEPGLVIADSALHRRRVSAVQLEEQRAVMRRHRGSRELDLVVRLMDGRAESVGESRSRYLFWRQHLPKPEVQFEVVSADGTLVGTCDLALPAHRLLFEFDGRVKYGRLLKPGQDPGEVVFDEKLREDALRRVTGFAMERAVWADLATPASTAARIRRRMAPVDPAVRRQP